MPAFLVLTVGTGTAGPHSNLVLGLQNTLGIVKPDHYWLVPSASADSTAVADLVRELHPAGFEPWSPSEPYRCIESHDSIAHCRDTMAEVLRHVRTLFKKGDRLLVNPTSGTKQMSAGATLAALDLEADEIQFTVGDRADGVVRTGTERLERFDPLEVFVSRDLRIAGELSAAGSHLAAHRLLARHARAFPLNALDLQIVAGSGNEKLKTLVRAHELATLTHCLHEWERQNYEAARQLAARCNLPQAVPARAPLQAFAEAAKSSKPHAAIVSDLLATATLLHRRGDHETSLFLACKALEGGLRLRLMELTGLSDPYSLEILRSLPVRPEILKRAEATSHDGTTTVLGLNQVVDILTCLSDPLAAAYRGDWRIASLVRLRNEYTHALRPIDSSDSRVFLDLVQNLFAAHLPLPAAAPRPAFS
jgi:hypothetical protein